MPSQLEIANRFKFHPATTEEKRNAHSAVRTHFSVLAGYVAQHTPPGREQALALTKLEEGMHWANAAIALANDEPPAEQPMPVVGDAPEPDAVLPVVGDAPPAGA